MKHTKESQFAQLLKNWQEDEEGAFADLMSFVYADLLKISGNLLSKETAKRLEAKELISMSYSKIGKLRKTEISDYRDFLSKAKTCLNFRLRDHLKAHLPKDVTLISYSDLNTDC